MIIRDGRGIEQRLFFTTDPVDETILSYFELPPLPPEGSFDARFTSQGLFESIHPGKPGVVLIHSAHQPLRIDWDVHIGKYQLLSGKSAARLAVLEGKGFRTIDTDSLSKLELVDMHEKGEVPKDYALIQNYPNPFNPTTNFRFSILDFGMVTLRVYDMLGREIATLVNEAKEPGEYTISWDATGMPSGVYYYKLQAGSFHDTKAMLLIR
ncbi:MAG: T9SS type A sorting domain-containing protein [Ignavibacteriae bacterium]|nr:T9SS type A sorting domain-containing protein [Ignavibacteria bacterium]MBI3363975.1 T9SS type A sorting domain-containing protein [Ignavibacteriota bacterium]